MLTLISLLWARKGVQTGVYITAALAVAGLVIWIMWMRMTIADLKTENVTLSVSLTQQQQVNRENLEAIAKLKQDHERQIAALSLDRSKSEERDRSVATIKEKIRYVTVPTPGAARECRTAGPELRAAFDGLRDLAHRPAGAGATRGPAGNPGGPPALQAGSGGSDPESR